MSVTTIELYVRLFSQNQVVADFLRDILPAQAGCRFDADGAWCDEHLSRALQGQLGVTLLVWRTAQVPEPSTLVFVLDPHGVVDEGVGDRVENVVRQIRAGIGDSACGASAISTDQAIGVLHIVFVFAGCLVRDGVPSDVAPQSRLDMVQGRSGREPGMSAEAEGVAGVSHRPGVSIFDEDLMVLPPDYAAAVERIWSEATEAPPELEGLPPCGRLARALMARQALHQMEADRADFDQALAALVRHSLSKNKHFRLDLPSDASLSEIMEHLKALSKNRPDLDSEAVG